MVTGAVSAEWVPIRPKTDAAFLYAVIHSILREREWRNVCDLRFLQQDTNSPYLVGPHGYFMRAAASDVASRRGPVMATSASPRASAGRISA